MKDFEKEVVIMKDEKILSNEELLEITGEKFIFLLLWFFLGITVIFLTY